MWLLPWPFSIDKQQRIEGLVRLIKIHQPDVVHLQEVWLNSDKAKIIKALPDYFALSAKNWLYNKSGLVTLTKIKPIASRSYFFKKNKNYNIQERLANKGWLHCRVQFAGQLLNFINLHLYDPQHTENLYIVDGQFKKLKKFCSTGDYLLAGDFNLADYELAKLNEDFFEIEKDKAWTLDEASPYSQSRFNKKGRVNMKADYFLSRAQTAKIEIAEFLLIKEPAISNHYPILYTLAIDKK